MAKKCPKKSEIRLHPGEQKRADWDRNHIAIKEALIELTTEKKRAPANSEIADRTGLTIKTVERHMKEVQFGEVFGKARNLGALFTEEVMLGMIQAARTGSAPNQRLYWQIVHGWSEKETDTEETGAPIHHVIELVPPAATANKSATKNDTATTQEQATTEPKATTQEQAATEQQAAKGQPANGQRDNAADTTAPDGSAV